MALIEQNTVRENPELAQEATLLSGKDHKLPQVDLEQQEKARMNEVLRGVYASQIKIRLALFYGLASLLGGAIGMFGSHFIIIENWSKKEPKVSSELIAPIQSTNSESSAAAQKESPFTVEDVEKIETMQQELDKITNKMNEEYRKIQENLAKLAKE